MQVILSFLFKFFREKERKEIHARGVSDDRFVQPVEIVHVPTEQVVTIPSDYIEDTRGQAHTTPSGRSVRKYAGSPKPLNVTPEEWRKACELSYFPCICALGH